MNGCSAIKSLNEPIENLESNNNNGSTSNEIAYVKRSPSSLSSVSCLSSTSSSSAAEEPFKALYSVTISPSYPLSKDGHVIVYKVHTQVVDSVEVVTVHRRYEDFEQLNQILIDSLSPGYGLIFPPFPEKSMISTSIAEITSREKLGPNTRALISDEWNKDCWYLQEYLRLMLSHPVFGKEPVWELFLCSPEAPQAIRIKKSSNFIIKMSENIKVKGKHTHKDCEEYFQTERDWNELYTTVIKQTSESFNNIISERNKLCGVLAHLSTALNMNCGNCDTYTARMNLKFCNLFSIAIDDYRRGLEIINYNDQASLGCTLALWSKYAEAEKAMLLQRTGLLIEYEKSNKNYDKAKPNQKNDAEKTKIEAERLFDECSDVARQEIKRFYRERSAAINRSIANYRKAHLLVNKDIIHMLQLSLENLKHFRLR